MFGICDVFAVRTMHRCSLKLLPYRLQRPFVFAGYLSLLNMSIGGYICSI